MKLRNKKTGIIGELHFEPDKEYHFTVVTEDPADVTIYKKLADLYVEWEDVLEEPKEYWYIKHDGCITITCGGPDDDMKQIGNYFGTKEEAELAVEKLKAYKRLKDKGISFGMRRHSHYGGEMFWQCPNGSGISDKQIWRDLDLLFSEVENDYSDE